MASLSSMTQFAGGSRRLTDDPKEAELKKISFLTAGLILASFRAGTALAAPDWTIHYNVKYGVSDQEKADLYLLNKGVNAAVVLIHGGAWEGGDKSNFSVSDAEMFATAGFSVVSINYRLASYADPTTQWNAQLQDAQLAIRWLRQNADVLRIDLARIGALGESAGGHLALFLGSLKESVSNLSGRIDRSAYFSKQSPQVSAVVDLFGPTDLTQPAIYTWLAPLALFGARSYFEVPNLYRDASPIFALGKKSAPTCIVQGITDTVVPLSQSIELRDRLSSMGVPYQWIPFSGGHAFTGLPSSSRNAIYEHALQCLSEYLHPDPLRPAAAAASGSAQVADISIGRHLAETVCSACHQISANAHGPGPNAHAPNFANISRMSMSKLDIKIFLRSSHTGVPNVTLNSAEIDSVAAYIKSLNDD
jgi:acetyl esterase/lipase